MSTCTYTVDGFHFFLIYPFYDEIKENVHKYYYLETQYIIAKKCPFVVWISGRN